MAYYIVLPDPSANPSEDELYEYIDGEFVLTEDSEVDSDKDYYEYEEGSAEFVEYEVQGDDNPREIGLYVFVDDEYVLTEDELPVVGTTYYMSIEETADESYAYFPVDDEEVYNPQEQALYVEDNGLYSLSEDTEPVEGTVYYQLVIEDDIDYDLSSEDDDIEEYPENQIDDLSDLFPPAYTVTDPTGKTQYSLVSALFAYANEGDNPNTLGWLERVGDTEYGVLTDDVVVQEGKLYYIEASYSDYVEENVAVLPNDFDPSLASSNYYVYDQQNEEYVLTTDTRLVPGRKYYRLKSDDEELLYMPDPMTGLEVLDEDDL